MTFDEATAKVGTYLKNNDLSNSENNDRFFYIILNGLHQEYAPIIEMTKEQKRILDSYREPGLYDGDYAFYVFYDEAHDYRLSLRDTTPLGLVHWKRASSPVEAGTAGYL